MQINANDLTKKLIVRLRELELGNPKVCQSFLINFQLKLRALMNKTGMSIKGYDDLDYSDLTACKQFMEANRDELIEIAEKALTTKFTKKMKTLDDGRKVPA